MEKGKNTVPEVVIPKGYEIDEVMDFGDEMDEEPIFQEEVRIRFER